MSKKQFKSQASSSRAVSGAFGGSDAAFNGSTFGVPSSFGAVSSSPLSYVYEPPDLTGISEPNVVVAFKNVQKKDSTTKSKALEDLQGYVLSLGPENGGVEDAILEAWIKIYPRTSIDSARRVRQLAHTLQGHLSVSCGKRIAKHMPKIVGPWLAGLYDSDKIVSRATQESFKQVFSSEDKIKNVWMVYQEAILEYSRDVIIKETANTLSDERTTSPDDASSKYTRVIGAAILVVTHVIIENPPAVLHKHPSTLVSLLGQEKLWDHASNSDPSVRRAVYRLLVAALTKQKDALNMAIISRKALTASLHINQAGSAFDYSMALASVTVNCPDVWTRYYNGSGKKAAIKRLCQFLRKGSQGGPSEYWLQISSLLCHVPTEVLLGKSDNEPEAASSDAPESILAILDALHDSIASRDEPRTNQGVAWNVYLDVSVYLQSILESSEENNKLFEYCVLPLLVQYIKPSQISSKWTVPGPQQITICFRAFEQMVKGARDLLEKKWHQLSATIVDDIRTSLPEQSKEYIESQNSLSAESSRWYNLQAFIFKEIASDSIRSLFTSTLFVELQSAMDTIRARNGKPYGAASTLESGIRLLPELILRDKQTRKVIADFVLNDIPGLLLSPSAPYCIDILNHVKGVLDVRQTYRDAIILLREAPDSTAKTSALQRLISSPSLDQSGEAELLAPVVKYHLEQLMSNDSKDWTLVMATLGNPVVPTELASSLISSMADSLSTDEKTPTGLHGLELTAKINRHAMKSFILSENGSGLLSKLLRLSESPNDDISRQATNVSVAIDAILSEEKVSGHATRSIVEIINQEIVTAGADSLSVVSLISQACKVWDQASREEKTSVAAELLPNGAQFTTAFRRFLSIPPNLSLAITNFLGGAINLIEQSPASEDTKGNMERDMDGYSPALRIIWYITKLIKATDIFGFVTEKQQAMLWKHMSLFLQLAGDNISVPGSNDLWNRYDSDMEAEILELTTEVQSLLALWLQDKSQEKSSLSAITQSQLSEESQGLSPASYYSARAYSAISSDLQELRGHTARDGEAERLRSIRKSEEVFLAAALLSSASDSKALLRLCNELISDLTGSNSYENADEGLRQLVLLNCILQGEAEIIPEIPQQRLVFFVNNIVKILSEGKMHRHIKTEVFKALTVILPLIKEIYGSFWVALIGFTQTAWSSAHPPIDDEITSLHASLRLLLTLYRLSTHESNDDLQDAWNENTESIARGLLSLLSQLQALSDTSHQPRKILNELVARMVKNIPPSSSEGIADLYPVLASESVALQTAAFEIMHQHISAQQEQVSFDKALSKDFKAELPEALLSLILAVPSLNALAEASFERTMPPALRTYLLSWKLVFDHWTNSSFKVRADYVASLKEGAYLNDLLKLTFDILINARSKPIDATKYDIEFYTPSTEEYPEKETHWLLIHLYYLSLKYLQTHTRNWWRDCISRQTLLAVESWTEKYISRLIIASELSTISSWAPSQATADAPLNVKVSPSTREITASIPVDEQNMQIAIHLPPTYPLARATVDSVHRVGVDEKKWRGWLITTQGAINFSSADSGEGGNLIDGLLAWRKNVTATMKGQTECAICYSVVGVDGQLPGKRCGTCKNMFHGSCLYKWFKSSNSSSCPLCRNAFNYA